MWEAFRKVFWNKYVLKFLENNQVDVCEGPGHTSRYFLSPLLVKSKTLVFKHYWKQFPLLVTSSDFFEIFRIVIFQVITGCLFSQRKHASQFWHQTNVKSCHLYSAEKAKGSFKLALEKKVECFFFFYLGFLSRTFTIHRTAGEGGGYLFNSSLPLPPTSETLKADLH